MAQEVNFRLLGFITPEIQGTAILVVCGDLFPPAVEAIRISHLGENEKSIIKQELKRRTSNANGLLNDEGVFFIKDCQ